MVDEHLYEGWFRIRPYEIEGPLKGRLDLHIALHQFSMATELLEHPLVAEIGQRSGGIPLPDPGGHHFRGEDILHSTGHVVIVLVDEDAGDIPAGAGLDVHAAGADGAIAHDGDYWPIAVVEQSEGQGVTGGVPSLIWEIRH